MWNDQNWNRTDVDGIPKYTKKITLKILKCNDENCWYYDKIGQKFEFWKKIFKDDQGFESLWIAKKPVFYYVHISDTDYIKYTRLLKLKKINKKLSK